MIAEYSDGFKKKINIHLKHIVAISLEGSSHLSAPGIVIILLSEKCRYVKAWCLKRLAFYYQKKNPE